MYLYYLERVVRWAAGDDTLRLPYWDYTDPNQLALPADFQSMPSRLYDAKRDPGMNTGGSTLSADSTDVDDLLPISDYFAYEDQIESGVHGYVHCTVGPTCPVAHMGDVPVAGNDPVFYHHHGNIDRLWACWQALHPTPPGDWQDQPFSFVDETGTLQTQPVKNFLDSTVVGYVYDNSTACTRTPALPAAAPTPTPLAAVPREPGPIPEERAMPTLGSLRGVAIDRPSTSFDVAVPQRKLAGALADLERPGRVMLVLRDLTAESHPGVLFDVFLAKTGDPTARQHVGTISWFGAFRHHGRQGTEKRTLRYDVTDELRALGGRSLAGTGVTVVIEATHGRKAKDPAQAETQRRAAGAAFRAAANLRIGAIELRAVPESPER